MRFPFGPVRWLLLLVVSGAAYGIPASPTLQQIADDFDRELAPATNDRWPLVRLAEVQLEKGDARTAVKSCREALSRYGKDSLGHGRALLVLSRAQLALKEHSLSVAALDLILRDGPEELAGEAQLQKGLIESEFLLTPGRFLTVLRRLSLENPMTLDFDMLRYMVGTEKGYRLDRIDVALAEFKKAWQKYPKGNPASEALLHQALLEGLVLSRTDVASHLVDRLAENYPNARVVSVARVLQATLMMAKGRHKQAAKVLAEVGDDSPVIREAVYLQGLCTAYYLDDPATGLGLFESMEKHPGSAHWTRVARYHCALLNFAAKREPAAALRVLDQRVDRGDLKGEELTSAQRFDAYGQQLRHYINQVERASSPESKAFAYVNFWYGQHHFSRALKELDQFLADFPDSKLGPRARMLRGKILQEDMSRPDEARESLEAAAEGSLPGLKGEIEWRSARIRSADEGAKAAFHGIYKEKGNPFRVLAGVEEAKDGAFSEREKRELLQEVVSHEPSGDLRARLLVQLAKAYRDSGNPARAFEVYEMALAFDPKLAPEVAKARHLYEIQEIEAGLAHDQLLGAQAGDPVSYLRIGRLYLLLDRQEEAKKAFRSVAKALAQAKSKAAKKGVNGKAPPTPKGNGVGDQAKLELVKLNVKASNFSLQALRYVNEFLDSIPKDSPLRAEAIAVKLDLLEKDGDAKKEFIPLCRYVVEKGYKVEQFSIRLAKAYDREKRPEQALNILSAVKFGKEHGPEAYLLMADLQEKLKQDARSVSTLKTLATRWPESEAGKKAGARYAQHVAKDLEADLNGSPSDEKIHHAIDVFLKRMRQEWVATVRGTVERLATEAYLNVMNVDELSQLMDLLTGTGKNAPDYRLLARLQERAAAIAKEPEAFRFRVDAAISKAAAGEPEKAITLLNGLVAQHPVALLQIAIIQQEQFKDAQSALEALDRLLAADGIGDGPRTKAYLRKATLTRDDPRPLLQSALQRVSDPNQRALILERLAVLEKGKAGKTPAVDAADQANATGVVATADSGAGTKAQRAVSRSSAQLYMAAAAATSDHEDKVRLTLEAARELIAGGAYTEASKALQKANAHGTEAGANWDPRLQALFLKSEAMFQVERLQSGVNWDDPESPTNLQILLSQARLLISPLREYDKAQALLSQIEGLFPAAAKGTVEALRREMSQRWALRSLEDKEDKLPRELMQLAVSLEQDLDDYASAARYLNELLSTYPTDSLATVARFRLIRLYALQMGRREDAAKLAKGLADAPDAADFGPERAACVNLVVAQMDYTRARTRAEEAARDNPRGSPALIKYLARMGHLAVEDFRDQKLATEVLQRIVALVDGPSGALARAEGYRLAMAAAVSLSPLRAAVYAVGDRAGLLKQAGELADAPEERAHVLFEQGLDHVHQQELDEAAACFKQAGSVAPGSVFGRDAMLELARLEEGRKNLAGARDAYALLAKVDASPHLVKLASKQLPRMDKLVRSEQRDIQLAENTEKKPGDYYKVAKQQLLEDEDLERALVNFRTYIRLGKDDKRLVDAHMESAEILVRLERPKEALEVLGRMLQRYPQDVRAAEAVFRQGQVKEVQMVDLVAADKDYRRVKRDYPDSKWVGEADKGIKRIVETRKERERAKKEGAAKSAIGQDIAAIRKKYIKQGGSFEEAIAALKAQIEAASTPDERAAIYAELATIYDKELKDYLDAVEYYEKFLGDCTDHQRKGDVFLRVAQLKAKELKQPQEALEMYQEFPTQYYNHPRKLDALLATADLNEKYLNDVQAAINVYRNIADSYPRSGYDEQALMRIAELSRKSFADYNGAIAALRQLVQNYPFSANTPYAQLQIGNILEVELSDKNSAVIEYQRVIDSWPQSGAADAARSSLVRIKGRN